jgi:hypothetical protein
MLGSEAYYEEKILVGGHYIIKKIIFGGERGTDSRDSFKKNSMTHRNLSGQFLP